MKQLKRGFSLFLCLVMLFCALPTAALAANAAANTMRLEQWTGTVTVKNASGKELKASKKMYIPFLTM